VILCSYAEYEEAEAREHRPRLIYVDQANRRAPSPPPHALLRAPA
jgi:aspartate 1-decarboxylase